MKKLLIGLTLLVSTSSFASEIVEGNRVIYFNAFQKVVVGTVHAIIKDDYLAIDIDNDFAAGLVNKNDVVAVKTDTCGENEFCVGETYREPIGADQYNIGEVKEVFSNGWRVVKNDNSLIQSVVHKDNLEKL